MAVGGITPFYTLINWKLGRVTVPCPLTEAVSNKSGIETQCSQVQQPVLGLPPG